jgi:hypothetical protein
MSYPKLPVPAPGEVLLVSTCYEEDKPRWDEVLGALGGRRDGDVVTLDDGGARLRLAEHPRWDFLHGGNFPALLPEDGEVPPLVALADLSAVYGAGAVLLVDLKVIPGRGVRVPADALGRVLAQLLGGSLHFDELVRGMDRNGYYPSPWNGPATSVPTTVVRASYPPLPATELTLLVRTDFTDDASWRALMEAHGKLPKNGGDDEFDLEFQLESVVVDDREFEHLQPGQVPALVPPEEHTIMVALADAETMADPKHPLFVVDLYDTPGQATRVPLAEAGLMAVNLEIANMDFSDFVDMEFE